jgi:hypothetical protein
MKEAILLLTGFVYRTPYRLVMSWFCVMQVGVYFKGGEGCAMIGSNARTTQQA